MKDLRHLTPQALTEEAKAHSSKGPSEFNFPAEIIMFLDFQQGQRGRDYSKEIRHSAEEALLQLYFINLGLNPSSVFVMDAHRSGWRILKGTLRKIDQ